MTYAEKLFDKRWKNKRKIILSRDGSKCRICGATENLVVHHKQYHFSKLRNDKVNPWEYADKYLITLCNSCHARGHGKYTIPRKDIFYSI